MFFSFTGISRGSLRRTGIKQLPQERQGIVLPVLGAPFLAAALPAAGAAAVGIYGTYGDEIEGLVSSLLGKLFSKRLESRDFDIITDILHVNI